MVVSAYIGLRFSGDLPMNFSREVSGKLGCYVYRLIDPRSGQTFYVGKGRGSRVFSHAAAKLGGNEDEDDTISLKLSIIRAIRKAGHDVGYIIHRHGMSDEIAIEVEAALIDAYFGLSNQVSGHDSGDRGVMSVKQIEWKYSLPVIDHKPKERLVLVNINSTMSDDALTMLERAQFSWKMNKSRAEKAQYVLAVERGVVRGAFKPHRWVEATAAQFPARTTDTSSDRLAFVGEVAETSVWECFVGADGKRIEVPELKHGRNPVRYCNIP